MKTSYEDSFAIKRVEEALRRIASVREIDGRMVIDVPVMYPSGATVVVEIERHDDSYWVSDRGYGLIEAEFAGAQSYYHGVAKRVAEDFGVGFDGNAMFALRAPSQRLEAAIVCVANASNKACSEAIRQASETKVRRLNEKIFERITNVFGERLVARSRDVEGRHAQWIAHNVVVFPDRHLAIFEHMTGHTTSISTKFLMFSDIKASSADCSLNAVVGKIDSLDDKAQMIGDVANIVSFEASSDEFMRYARAS